MAVLALQDASAGLGGISLVAAAAGGDQIPAGTRAAAWDLGVILVVRNAHTAAWVVTVAGHPPVTVPLGGGIGIIPVTGGVAFGTLVGVTYSGVTALTVAAVRLVTGMS